MVLGRKVRRSPRWLRPMPSGRMFVIGSNINTVPVLHDHLLPKWRRFPRGRRRRWQPAVSRRPCSRAGAGCRPGNSGGNGTRRRVKLGLSQRNRHAAPRSTKKSATAGISMKMVPRANVEHQAKAVNIASAFPRIDDVNRIRMESRRWVISGARFGPPPARPQRERQEERCGWIRGYAAGRKERPPASTSTEEY